MFNSFLVFDRIDFGVITYIGQTKAKNEENK